MKKKKLLIYGGILLIVLIIFTIIGKKAGWIGKGFVTKISTELPSQRTIVEIITANGKVQPETEVKISADVSGEIVELYVKEGQEIKQGDLLAKIKPDTYLSNLDRMEAALNSSKSNVTTAKARLVQIKAQYLLTEQSYNRNKKLFDQGAISQSEFESAQSSYDIGKAQVDAAEQDVSTASYSVKSSEASLKEAKENLSKTSIFAPMSGTISKLNVEKGERVVGTIQMAGTEIMRIANLNKMEVIVNVNENDIVRVKANDTALIEIDAYLNHKFKGIVREIANSANSSNIGSTDQVTNFEVKISILADSYQDLIPKDKPNYYPFRPGMSATVDIQTKTKYSVLSVPIQCVTTRIDSTGTTEEKNSFVQGEEGDNQTDNANEKKENKKTDITKKEEPKEVVFVYNNGVVKMIYVKTGIQDNNYIEILTGLNEKDDVVSAPYNVISKKLKDKMKVEKVEKEKLFETEK